MASRPTAKRRRLGRRMRELRNAAGLTHQQAAAHLGCLQPKMSKLENAQIAISPDEVRQLCELYRVDPITTEELVKLARAANKRGWHHSYHDTLNPEQLDYTELETDAHTVFNFEIDLIPGLMQTPDYARAVIAAADPDAPQELIDRRVELRMKRQRRIADGSLSLWAVVPMEALTRPIGGAEVLRDQLARVAELTKLPNVQFQILPVLNGEHIAMGTPFSCFRFPDGDGIVAIDHLTGTFYLEDRPDVERYRLAFQHLCSAAMNQRDSLLALLRLIDREHGSWGQQTA